MKTISNEKLSSWIKKKYKMLIEEVSQDSEVWEVVLLPKLETSERETIWCFGKSNYEEGDYTQAEIKSDLDDFLANVREVESTQWDKV
jgi:hypothetical protein